MKKKFIFALLAIGLVLSSCNSKKENTQSFENSNVESISNFSSDSNKNKENKKIVYASFFPIYDLTKQIAGDKLHVESFSNLETDAHEWEPSAKDMADLEKSELLIVNGADMEDWLSDVKESSNIEILNTTKNVKLLNEAEENGDDDVNEKEDYDPHTWLSLENAEKQSEAIAKKLGEIDSENKDYYMKNYEKLKDELDSMIAKYKDEFSKIKNKRMYVSHKAFEYLADEFGLEEVSLTGLRSNDDPNPKIFVEIINEARKDKAKTVFYEKDASDKAANALANEIGGNVKAISTLEFATDEDLKNDIHYQDIMKENLDTILEGLK